MATRVRAGCHAGFAAGEQEHAQDNLEAALELHERALRTRTKLYSPNDDPASELLVAQSKLQVAILYTKLGKELLIAHNFIVSASKVMGAFVSDKDLDALQAELWKGIVDYKLSGEGSTTEMDQVEDRSALQFDSKDMLTRTCFALQYTAAQLGTDNLMVAECLLWYGVALSLQPQQLSRAFRFFELAVNIRTRILGRRHKLVAEALVWCGKAACHRRDTPFLQEALAIQEGCLGTTSAAAKETRKLLALFKAEAWEVRKKDQIDHQWKESNQEPADKMLDHQLPMYNRQ